jgi:hypothetical protein
MNNKKQKLCQLNENNSNNELLSIYRKSFNRFCDDLCEVLLSYSISHLKTKYVLNAFRNNFKDVFIISRIFLKLMII